MSDLAEIVKEDLIDVKFSLLIVFTVTFILCMICQACSQRASKINNGIVRDMLDKMTYAKDSKTKLCFGTVASRHPTDMDQNGFTITWVPCTPEVEALIGK